MYCRGVRGAITVEENTRDAIHEATQELLDCIVTVNDIAVDDVASVVFTTTPDLNAAFPATAARQFGWGRVPLLCAHEISVPGALPRCIRVLVHWNTKKEGADIEHVYLRRARQLRPDLMGEWETPSMGSADHSS